MYLRNETSPNPGSGLLPVALRLRGRLDVPVLQAALSDLGLRHEALRTSFEFGPAEGLEQVVHRAESVKVGPAACAEIRPEEVAYRIARAAERPLDPAAPPLVRAEVWRVRDPGTGTADADDGQEGGPHGEWVLLLCVHQLVADSRSLTVLIEDLAAAYSARVTGGSWEPTSHPVQPADIAVWEREQLTDRATADQLAYWNERMAGAAALTLPTDRPRNGARSGTESRTPAAIPPATAAGLRALAEAEDTDLFAAVFAAWAEVLGRWAARSDVVIGAAAPRRLPAGVERPVGSFDEILPLRIEREGATSFRQLLRRARESYLESRSYAKPPVGTYGAEGGTWTRPSPVRAVLTLHEAPLEPPSLHGLSAEFVSIPRAVADANVSLELAPDTEGGLTGSLSWAADQFDADTAGRLVESMEAVCRAVAADPDAATPPPLVAEAQHRMLVEEFSGMAVPPRASRHIHEWVARRAAEQPDAVAVIADSGRGPDSRLTYRELERRADGVCRLLRARGVRPDDRIGVHLDRGLDLVTVLLGVLKSGAAYVPLDPQLPPGRLDHVLRDARPAVCFSTSATAPELPRGDAEDPPEIVSVDGEEFGHDAGAGRPAERAAAGQPETPHPGSGAAYVVYTSGSTGAPKGVVVTRQGLSNQLTWLCEEMGFGPDDVILHKTPLASDPSLWEILVPLMAGGRLVLAEPGSHGDPAYLLDAHDRHGVTACDFFPSLLRHFLAEPGVKERARALRKVICGGEELNARLAESFAAALPGAELYNLYGPTEATIAVTSQRVPRAVSDPIPVGSPVPGCEIHVLDEHFRPKPVGVPGELYIGGVQLARGYLNRPGQTAERFVPHPFRSGARLYRTGDRARWRSDGTLEFLGRLDHQIKVRGHRIEPAEVEAALQTHSGVSQALVTARASADGGKRLVAYLVRARHGQTDDTASLRRDLARRLPSGMIPSAFVWLDSFPLTAVGKVDRDALPEPEPGGGRRAPRPVPPQDPLQEVLLGVWSETLPAAGPLGVRDDFRTRGGTSEHDGQIADRVRELLRVELEPGRIAEAATVERLAALVRARSPRGGADVDRVAELVLRVQEMAPDEVTDRLRG